MLINIKKMYFTYILRVFLNVFFYIQYYYGVGIYIMYIIYFYIFTKWLCINDFK